MSASPTRTAGTSTTSSTSGPRRCARATSTALSKSRPRRYGFRRPGPPPRLARRSVRPLVPGPGRRAQPQRQLPRRDSRCPRRSDHASLATRSVIRPHPEHSPPGQETARHPQAPAGGDVFQLSGTVAKGGPLDPVSVNQPGVFFAHALRQALERRGIEVRGDVVRRQLSDADLSAATLLATHTTPLPDVLWRCNTFSQNMFAECVLKSLAAYEPDGRRSATARHVVGG